MNNTNKPAELSYYGLYLLSYLKENHPDKAHDAAFVEERQLPVGAGIVPDRRQTVARFAACGGGCEEYRFQIQVKSGTNSHVTAICIVSNEVQEALAADD